jgi:hypothetical protein
MPLKYEINVGGEWVEARTGIILADGRLGFTLPDGYQGVARPPYWRHSEVTTSFPDFRRLCFYALTPEEQESARVRLRGEPEF